jgi:glucose-6-phosphate isomerase
MEPRSQAQDTPANELARGNALVRDDAARALQTLAERDICRRIWNRDHTVWRSDPTEIRDRLGWLDLPRTMPARIPEMERIAEEVRAQADDIVLLGMGGSSLAPEVFAQSFGARTGYPRLHVLDSTSPNRIRAVAESLNWKRVHFLTSSKSGSTIEMRTLFAYFFERIREAGPGEPGRCFTAITDPGTSLAELAAAKKFARVRCSDSYPPHSWASTSRSCWSARSRWLRDAKRGCRSRKIRECVWAPSWDRPLSPDATS